MHPSSSTRTLLAIFCFDGEHEVRTAQVAMHNPLAICVRNGIVLIKEESIYRAGHVQLHCAVYGAALSLVTVFTLIEHVPDAGDAVWMVGRGCRTCANRMYLGGSGVHKNGRAMWFAHCYPCSTYGAC